MIVVLAEEREWIQILFYRRSKPRKALSMLPHRPKFFEVQPLTAMLDCAVVVVSIVVPHDKWWGCFIDDRRLMNDWWTINERSMNDWRLMFFPGSTSNVSFFDSACGNPWGVWFLSETQKVQKCVVCLWKPLEGQGWGAEKKSKFESKTSCLWTRPFTALFGCNIFFGKICGDGQAGPVRPSSLISVVDEVDEVAAAWQ